MTAVEDLEEAFPDGFLVAVRGTNEDNLSNRFASDMDDKKEVNYSRYEGSGVVQSETFVEAARKTLQGIADRVRPLVERDDATGKSVAQILLNSEWMNAQIELGKLFVADGDISNVGMELLPNLAGTVEQIDEEDRLEDLEDLIEALSSERNFRDALETGGKFSAFDDQQPNAEKIYNASSGAIALGATDNTRYGVVVDPSSATSTAESVAMASGSPVSVKAFAYSPLDLAEVNSLPARGTARYTGRTFAADASGEVFDGAIELLGKFRINEITATISDLESVTDNDPWQHEGRDVEQIVFELTGATAVLPGNASRFMSTTISAKLSRAGTRFTSAVDNSTFRGMFVGKSGQEVFGLWSLGPVDDNLIEGSYGAEYRSTQRVQPPSSDSNGETVYGARPSGVAINNTADTFTIMVGAGFPANPANKEQDQDSPTDFMFDLSDLYGNRSITKTGRTPGDENPVTHTLRVRTRNTRYTRFGAWAHTTRMGTTDASPARGWYGYSSLPVTPSTSRPARGEAEYEGRTMAVETLTGTLYDGQYVLVVNWGENGTGEIESEITGLAPTGGGSRLAFNGRNVALIAFQHEVVTTLAEDANHFGNLATQGTLIEYTDNSTSETLSGQTHEGQFVGESVDGPLAVVGNWSVTKDGKTIQGVFGADLDP